LGFQWIPTPVRQWWEALSCFPSAGQLLDEFLLVDLVVVIAHQGLAPRHVVAASLRVETD